MGGLCQEIFMDLERLDIFLVHVLKPWNVIFICSFWTFISTSNNQILGRGLGIYTTKHENGLVWEPSQVRMDSERECWKTANESNTYVFSRKKSLRSQRGAGHSVKEMETPAKTGGHRLTSWVVCLEAATTEYSKLKTSGKTWQMGLLSLKIP